MWIHHFVIGLLLGWGAAIPIGPINIEIIRRNLNLGTKYGVSFGLGASSADVTYFILLLAGAIVFLKEPSLLKYVGIIGSLILFWFSFVIFHMNAKKNDIPNQSIKKSFIYSHYFHGYIMTLVNPFTILFWASISASVASVSRLSHLLEVVVGSGVIVGAVSWVIGLNIILHMTRHRLSEKTVKYLNYVGAIIIFCFACYTLFHTIKLGVK